MKKQEFSKEHLLYLRRQKQRTVTVHSVRILLLLLFLVFWEVSAKYGVIDAFIFSSPSRILKTTTDLYRSGTLATHVTVTLKETVFGFCIAVGVGYLIALFLWWSEIAKKIAEPYLVVLNALPKIALGPLIIIWFGTGMKAIVCMTVLIGIVIAVMNMLGGFNATDENKLLLLRSMGATKLQILLKLVVPSSLPTFISMLKINVGMAWIGSIMGEYIVSRAGIGYLIVYGGQVFRLDLVMSAVFILCLLTALMYGIVAIIEKLTIRQKY